MPRAYGRDRVESLDRGRVRIVSPAPKGWRAGKQATRTTAEFPGTAVAWDGALWEVVSSEERSGANSRYVLVPWRDNHAIRLAVDYSAASEIALEATRRKGEARNRMSAGIFAMGLFAGQLPAHVQRQIESEYGFVAPRMTLLSLVPEIVFAGIAVMGLPIEDLPGPKWPAWVLVLGFLALVDVLARSWYCLMRNLPLGSVPGLLAWYVAMMVFPGARRFDREATRVDERGRSTTSARAPSDFEREHDAYAVREPFLALLPASDQMRLATTFGFDPIAWGRRSALTIAAVAGSGVLSSLIKIGEGTAGVGTLLSLVIAALLFAEQLLRFREFSR
ncbi:MAG: hypothetical protein NDJ92_17915, partial [Thermoanaerobaculia bacterium]|nr:hypothetical protein [Thermoanaerobaculia bacterium]